MRSLTTMLLGTALLLFGCLDRPGERDGRPVDPRTSGLDIFHCSSEPTSQNPYEVIRLAVGQRKIAGPGEYFVVGRSSGSHQWTEALGTGDGEWEWNVSGTLTPNEIDLVGGDAELHFDRLSQTPALPPGLYTGLLTRPDAGQLFMACWRPFAFYNPLPTGRFWYNSETGRCIDDQGFTGFNDLPFPFVRDTGQGECSRIQGMINEDDLTYPTLSLNLRGADLSWASLSFADLVSSDLSGADMTLFKFGYARVDGPIDRHTQLPSQGCTADPEKESVTCFQ